MHGRSDGSGSGERTGLAIRRVAANEGFGQFKCELTLANAIIARKEQRIRNAAIGQKVLERLSDVFVSDEFLEHLFEDRGDHFDDARMNLLN